MREHAQTLRSEETSEARAATLEILREHERTLRSEETSEARAARLERMREHVQLFHVLIIERG